MPRPRAALRFVLPIALALLVVGLIWRQSRPPVPVRVWRVTSVPGFSGRMVRSSDGTLFAADLSEVFAVGPSGRIVWRVEPAESAGARGGTHMDLTLLADGTVLAGRRDVPDQRSLVRIREGRVIDRQQVRFETPLGAGPPALVLGDDVCVATAEGIVRLARDGRELWRFETASPAAQPPTRAPDDSLLCSDRSGTTNWMVRLNADGTLRWRRLTDEGYGGGPAFGRDGTIYLGRGTNATLVAFDPDGNERWRLSQPEVATCCPTVGGDGTLYLGGALPGASAVLLASAPDGRLKWRLQLGRGLVVHPPVEGRDGTIYLASMDRLVRAVDRTGRLLWRHQVAWQFDRFLPRSAVAWAEAWQNRFGYGRPSGHGPPILGTDGVLYVNFDTTGSIHAFDVEPPARSP